MLADIPGSLCLKFFVHIAAQLRLKDSLDAIIYVQCIYMAPSAKAPHHFRPGIFNNSEFLAFFVLFTVITYYMHTDCNFVAVIVFAE